MNLILNRRTEKREDFDQNLQFHWLTTSLPEFHAHKTQESLAKKS